jgi:hypothetical protein
MGRRIYRTILALCAGVLSLRLFRAGGCRAGVRPGAVAVRQSRRRRRLSSMWCAGVRHGQAGGKMLRLVKLLSAVISAGLIIVVAAPAPSFAATRPAGIIGAWVSGGSAAWETADSAFGPLQDARIFYTKALPASYAGSVGSNLPSGVTLVVSYNTPDTNVSSYVCSVPSTRNVILAFYHEPENQHSPFASGASFVTEFDAQSAEIRQDALTCGVTTVKVAMISMTWAYANSTRRGYSCSFIPTAANVDYYLGDTYEKNQDTLALDPGFQRWLTCTSTSGLVPQGLAEYGVGLGNTTKTGCQFTDQQRASVIQTDAAYLTANFPNFAMWSYSWVTGSQCWDSWQFPTGGAAATTWQNIATGAIP